MENNSVPYIVWEMTQAKHDRVVKRLVIALIITIVLMFVSNVIWLYAWNQYEYTAETTTYMQDGRGLNNNSIDSMQGDVTNGADTNDND